jgi:hypothetical protein
MLPGRRGLPRIAAEKPMGKDGADSARVTTSLSRAQKAELERIAKKRGVAMAWLLRHALERFIESEHGGPMLPLDGEHG